jgi:chromosome segregation ATPase
MLRRTHERIVEDFKNNNKIINDERKRISDKNIELQKEIKALKTEISAKEEVINEHAKTIDIITKERDKAIRIQRSETRTRKSKKYKEMEKIIETVKKENEELVEDLDKTRKEYDELRNSMADIKACNCDHDENEEEITVFKKDFRLTDEELAEKLNEAMRTEFPELPFTDIEPPIKISTEVKDGVIRPVKKQPKNKGKRINKANKNSKMNNRRKGSK